MGEKFLAQGKMSQGEMFGQGKFFVLEKNFGYRKSFGSEKVLGLEKNLRVGNPFCCFLDLHSHLADKLSCIVQVIFCHVPLSPKVPLGDSGQLGFYASHL